SVCSDPSARRPPKIQNKHLRHVETEIALHPCPEDHSPKKLMLSEEIIPEKSGGETSSREMVYEVFVYPFPKIGHYVSVTRTGHRVGAASKREGCVEAAIHPPGAACHTSPPSAEFAQYCPSI